MIRIWAKIILDNKLIKDLIYESIDNYSRDGFFEHISEICYRLNISSPVLIKNHYESFENFNNIKFLPRDFIESVSFDRLEIENAAR